jgi:peptidoglycan/xylan/chitin deacetylase (PgdA/CDA1 family)
MITVCFRFDDPSAVSDHALERRIFDIFARRGVPLCVAVVPFARRGEADHVPVSPENVDHLIRASRERVIEVAQHGHSHIPRGADSLGRHSEFAGVAFGEQARLIGEGERLLTAVFGKRIEGFVPPWNTYDRLTAQALDEAGFVFLSAGSEGGGSGELTIIPRTCTLREAHDVLQCAAAYRLLSPVVVVVFHPDDFREFMYPPAPDEAPPFTDLDELEALLDWIKAQRGMDVQPLGGIARAVRHGQRLQNASALALPWRIKSRLPPILIRSNAWKALPGAVWGVLHGA